MYKYNIHITVYYTIPRETYLPYSLRSPFSYVSDLHHKTKS